MIEITYHILRKYKIWINTEVSNIRY